MAPSPFAKLTGDFMTDMPGLQSVDDFDLENPWEQKPKIVAVAAPKANMHYKVALHDICQKLGLVAQYDVRETAPYAFAGRIKIGSAVSIEDKGPFRSKKETEAALAEAAMPLVQRVQLDGQQRGNKDMLARKTMSEHLRSENWVGALQNYVQAHDRGYAVPQYQEYETTGKPPRFACTVTYPGGPLSPFGSTTELWPSKTEAKKAAAREAVLWLRSQGASVTYKQIPPSRPSKKHKQIDTPPQVDSSSGLTQALAAADVNAAGNDSVPQRVHNLVAFLGFTQPAWETKQSLPPAGTVDRNQCLGGFVDMACVFSTKDVAREPRLTGRMGEVKSVYGRKKARERCCLEVLRVLEEIRQSR